MKRFKTLLASLLLMVLCGQANAAGSDISLKNNSNGQVWVKFTLLYPATDSCKQNFPSDEQFNLILGPKDSTKVGPFDSECHISISASPSNKFYTICENGTDTTTGVSAEFSVTKAEILSCKVK
jgi:hypothetical protein